MRPRNHLISTKLAVLLIVGIVGGLFFVQGRLATEAQLTPTPSYHVDIGDIAPLHLPTSPGNTFTQDPDSSGSGAGNGFSDQIMSVPSIVSCVSKTVDFSKILERFVWTDVIIKNADEMAGADVRINWDPAKIRLLTAFLTPFGGVGLINLPEESGLHRTASPGFSIDNANGAAFLAGTYQGNRERDVSSESGPTVDSAVNSLPDRNAGQAPDGGVFVRLRWLLQPASDGTDVRFDLSPGGAWRSGTGGGAITVGSQFLTLTGEDPGGTTQITSLTNDDLFDGIISVNKTSPDAPCPPPDPVHDLEATIDDAATVILDPGNSCMSTNETNAVGNGLYKIKIEEQIFPGSVEKPILIGLLIDRISGSGGSVNTTTSATGSLAAAGPGSQVVLVKDATVVSDGPVNVDADADLERLTVMQTTGEATVQLIVNYVDSGPCVEGGTPAPADGGDYTVTVDVCLQGDPAPLGLTIAGPGLPGDCGTFSNGSSAHDTDATNDTPPSITVDSLSY